MRLLTYTFILLAFSLSSCSDAVNGKFAPKPTALGVLNDVVIISDNTIWEGMVGDTLRYFYESAYPIMPAPEPLFDLRYFSTDDLEAQPLRKELRTYVILANLSDKESPTTKMVRRDLGEEKFNKAQSDTTFISTVGQDKWARDQIVVYLFGNDHNQLAHNIKKTFPAVADRIKKHDQKQLASNVYQSNNEKANVSELLRQYFGVQMRIPGDYSHSEKLDKNFIIFKKDTPKVAQSIVMRKFKYSDASQMSKDAIIAMRNEYGKSFISGTTEGSYMRTNDIDLPVYEYAYESNGMYVKELRGIWELDGDFVGGPFVTYVFLNKEKGELIFVDTFVYAPGKDKRDYVQQLEYIAKTVKPLTKVDLGE